MGSVCTPGVLPTTSGAGSQEAGVVCRDATRSSVRWVVCKGGRPRRCAPWRGELAEARGRAHAQALVHNTRIHSLPRFIRAGFEELVDHSRSSSCSSSASTCLRTLSFFVSCYGLCVFPEHDFCNGRPTASSQSPSWLATTRSTVPGPRRAIHVVLQSMHDDGHYCCLCPIPSKC